VEAVGILSKSFEKELYNPKIEFNIDGIPVTIQCPIVAEATITLPDSSIKLGGGPWFKSKFGFWWDVGCRLTFKLKFIPWPQFWSHAGGVSDFDCGFDLVKPDFKNLLDSIEAEFGLSLNPGIVLATIINPYFKFAGMFDNILNLAGSKSYDLFFHIYGDFIIRLKIPFIGHHDFKLGRLFDKKWQLYSYSFVEIDEHSKWSANLNSLPLANSTPAVDENGSIYLGTEDGRLLAYDASGNKLWERQRELNSEFSPILDGHNRLYVASGNILRIFNSQTGEEIDCAILGDGNLTAAAIGEEPSGCIVMYCGTDNGSIYTYKIGGAGNPPWNEWIADDPSAARGILSIAIDSDGTIYAASDEAGLYAIDRETGQTKWHKKWPGQVANTVIVDDENTVFVAVGSILYALDSTTGLELRNRQVLLDSSGSGPVIANDGTIYAGGSKLSALSPEGNLLWEYDCGSNIENTPLIGSDGVIYVGTQNGKVHAVNSDGSGEWQFPALVNVGAIASSPSMTIDGTLYVTSNDSKLYAIKTESQGLANSPWPKRNLNDSNTSGNYVPSSLEITKNPESKVVMKGTDTTLSVTADLGSPPYSYQWMKDGSMIMGETGKDLTISGLVPADEGYYWAEVYDSSLPRRKILESERAYLEVNSNDIGEKKWTFQIGDPDNGATLTASPMLSRGYLLAVSSEGVLFGIKENGELEGRAMFSYEPIEVYGSPSLFKTTGYDADFVYVASTDGVVHAVKWLKFGWMWYDPWHSEKLGPIHSSPSIDPTGTVYVTCSDLYALVGLNAYYGTKTLEYIAPGYYSSSPAIADDGTIYFAPNNDKSFFAIYIDGGQLHHKWIYETQAGVISSPAIGADGTIYFASVDGTFYALRPDGMERWTYKIPGQQQAVVTSSPVVSGNGAVYIGTTDGKLYSFGTDGILRWVFNTDGGISSTPAIGSDGVIYLATMGGTIHAIDESGGELWRLDYGDGFTASPVIGNGIVYFGTNHGKIVAINCSSNGLDSGPWPKYKRDNFNSGRQ
jgi:outer membrane protein assembly factor BamB